MKKRLIAVRRARLKELFVDPYTYNIFKNKYIWFGFLSGLPIPLICLGPQLIRDLKFKGIAIACNTCIANPLHWFYLTVPFIFAFIFGCLGTFKIIKEVEADSYRILYKIRAKDTKYRKAE